MPKHKENILFLIILLISAFLRWSGINWDQGQHLHPDERHLSMVSTKLKPAANLKNYLNPQISKLNPYNVGVNSFVYGHLPLNLNKYLGILSNRDTYDTLTLQGRLLSGLFDILTVALIYKLAQLFIKKYNWPQSTKFWASLTYALATLPMQLSHFFAVDTFLNFFMLLSFYFAFKYCQKPNYKNLLLSALGFSLALACKITAFFVLPLNFWFILNAGNRVVSLKQKLKISLKELPAVITAFLIYLLASYFLIRLIDPYYFAEASWLNPSLHPTLVRTLSFLGGAKGTGWYPPAIQWLPAKPIIFALKNIVLIGFGIFSSLYFLSGIFFWLKHNLKKNKKDANFALIIFWVIAYFTFQSTRFVKSLRYFLPLYPYLAIIAGFGISSIIKKTLRGKLSKYQPALKALVIVSLGIYPLLMLNIYLTPHSRVTASNWIYNHIPQDSLILVEHWDDSLPLPMPDKTRHSNKKQLPVFSRDSEKKWEILEQALAEGDYYILSSNRAWGSIAKAPDKYPKMQPFYQKLLSDHTNYKKVAEFTNYPGLNYLGINFSIPDRWAEEAFSVYDHPQVIILKNSKQE